MVLPRVGEHLPIMNEHTPLPAHIAEKARRAALMGTRALIVTESFDALVALLVASGAVPVERAQSMLIELSSTLHARAQTGRHPEFQVEPGELRIHAERLAARAEQLAGGREGSVSL